MFCILFLKFSSPNQAISQDHMEMSFLLCDEVLPLLPASLPIKEVQICLMTKQNEFIESLREKCLMSLHERLFIWKQRFVFVVKSSVSTVLKVTLIRLEMLTSEFHCGLTLSPPPPRSRSNWKHGCSTAGQLSSERCGITGDQRFSLGPGEAETCQKDSRPEKTWTQLLI